MSNNANTLSRGDTWVLVADASRADIYLRQKRHGPLEAVQCLTEKQARSNEGDLVADEPDAQAALEALLSKEVAAPGHWAM